MDRQRLCRAKIEQAIIDLQSECPVEVINVEVSRDRWPNGKTNNRQQRFVKVILNTKSVHGES